MPGTQSYLTGLRRASWLMLQFLAPEWGLLRSDGAANAGIARRKDWHSAVTVFAPNPLTSGQRLRLISMPLAPSLSSLARLTSPRGLAGFEGNGAVPPPLFFSRQ